MHNLLLGQIFCGLAMVSQNVSTKLSTENVDKMNMNFIVQKSYSYLRISLFSTRVATFFRPLLTSLFGFECYE